jgi:hypothetical protein
VALWTATAPGRCLLHADAVPGTTRSQSPSSAEPRLRTLREEVGGLRQRETRRRFDACLHVGELGGQRTGFVIAARDLPMMDVQLRADVVSRLLHESPPDWRTAWVVREGTSEQHDEDLRWLSAVRTAYAMHDRRLDGCYAVTRYGWRDLITGEARSWARLRL